MATQMEVDKIRPNIRIEIPNDLKENEEMEIDEISLSGNEEGEIVDDAVTKGSFANLASEIVKKDWPNSKGIFTTGINIFDKQEQIKLQERAKRFALNPDEIHNFMETDLDELHESLGINAENENIIRFEAVHIIGTDKMSIEDILEYFVKYAPTDIEWVDEGCCNVIWPDNITAARALFYSSKVVNGMPAREPCNPFAKEFLDDIEEPEEEGTGQSVLLKNKNREIELKLDDVLLSNKINFKNAVDISEITIPIPPGYWRLGGKHPNAKCLLMRFAFKTDKKPYKTEQFAKYYKKHGNSIFGSSKGMISENKKKELRGIFERNKELNKDKNPWGPLAKNWDHDAKFREKEPDFGKEPELQVKNPSILVRLGSKRKSNESLNDVEIIEDQDKTLNTHHEKKKHKFPRMRMYADEEEEKVRRKKLIQTIKKQTENLSKEEKLNERDLRNILSNNNRKSPSKEEIIDLDPDVTDLGTKLRNRTKNMIFTVERDIRYIEYDRKENVHSDVRTLIEERRDRSPIYRRRSPHHYSSERRGEYRRSPVRRHRSPLRRSSPHRRRSLTRRRRSPEGTLHSDRIHPRHKHRRRHSDYSDDDTYDQKPRSKVAVVIKTQKKPTVASTIWSRVQRESESESESSSESETSESEEESSSSSEEESDSDSNDSSSSSSSNVKQVERPGFKDAHNKFSERINHRNTLKITMTNDHFKRKL